MLSIQGLGKTLQTISLLAYLRERGELLPFVLPIS
jgi:SNF2 family DNA or RNA helicase